MSKQFKIKKLNANSQPFRFLILIVMVIVAGNFATDMYVPALPTITHALGTSDTLVKWTLTIFILSFSIGQLIYGTLSDAFGRRRLLITGLGIGLAGSIICALASSIDLLLLGRLIQGLGLAAAPCLARSICRDTANGIKLAKMFSFISIAVMLSPAIAPIAGGYLQHYLGWHSVFFVYVGCLTLLIGFIIVWLPETNQKIDLSNIKLNTLYSKHKMILSNREFLGYSLCGSMAKAGIIIFFILSPFLLQNVLHVSVIEYVWLTLSIVISALLGRILNAILLNTFAPKQLMTVGNGLLILATTAMLITCAEGWLSAPLIIGTFSVYTLGASLLFPNASAAAFNLFNHAFGNIGSIYSFIQNFGCFTIGIAAAHSNNYNGVSLAVLLLVTALISNVGQHILARKSTVSALPKPVV
ncbi:MAG: multidrug effflux MFS transporter [Gammaproteobacteria bacterium]|nr:multidrug effflux MFS transporter [Gammaproteobacteria bacterium]